MILSRLSSRSRASLPAGLLRAASAIASAAGWEVHGPPGDDARAPSGEVRLIVSGGDLPGRCLLRLRPRPPRGSASADLLARRTAASEHVVGVVDEPPVVRLRGMEVEAAVIGYAAGGSLQSLIAERSGLRGGEAATILLGVAAGVRSLHGAGWSTPDLALASVVFVGDGCPALDGLDEVAAWTPSAAVADADRFYGFARTVCLHVVDGTGMMLLSAVEAGLRRGTWSAVDESILRTVAPEVVRVIVGSRPQGSTEVTSAVRSTPVTAQNRKSARRSNGSSPVGRLGPAPGRRLGAVMDALDGNPGRLLMHWVRGRLRRRPALVVIGLVPVAAALALIVLLPPSPGESASAAGDRQPSTQSPVATDSAGPMPSDRATAASPSNRPAPDDAAEGAAEGAAERAVSAGDPVEAARVLLDARLSCFRAHTTSSGCLEAVLDATSALLIEENAALGTPGAAASRDYSGAELSLVETWGGAALVGAVPDAATTPKSQPASLLLVRSEAGWRLREVFP